MWMLKNEISWRIFKVGLRKRSANVHLYIRCIKNFILFYFNHTRKKYNKASRYDKEKKEKWIQRRIRVYMFMSNNNSTSIEQKKSHLLWSNHHRRIKKENENFDWSRRKRKKKASIHPVHPFDRFNSNKTAVAQIYPRYYVIDRKYQTVPRISLPYRGVMTLRIKRSIGRFHFAQSIPLSIVLKIFYVGTKRGGNEKRTNSKREGKKKKKKKRKYVAFAFPP